MSDEREEFEALMRRVRAGCPQAAQELFDRYGKHIRRVVRARLDRRLRRVCDSQDIAQSVWISFFQGEDRLFNTPEELESFLRTMAQHKVLTAHRRRRTQKLQEAHEVHSLQGAADDMPPDIPIQQPTPSQVAIAEERWERLLRNQPPVFRRILEMLRAGHTHVEIAAHLGLNAKVIQRLLRQLNKRLGTS